MSLHQEKIRNFMKIPSPELSCFIPMSSLNDYTVYNNQCRPGYEEIERQLAQDDTFRIRCKCAVCQCDTDMLVDYLYFWAHWPDGKKIPNWRERLVCPSCGMNSRMRSVVHYLRHIPLLAQDTTRIYMPEAVSPTARYLASRYTNVTLSEYHGCEYKSGDIINGIRNENLNDLSMDDNTFSAIICLDILEHLSNYKSALSEIYRVLKPSGIILMSVPFNAMQENNDQRAACLQDGTIEYISPPEYHVNPFSPANKSLVYWHFGWQLLEDMRNIGFIDSQALVCWSREYGYLGRYNILQFAMKPHFQIT